MKCCLRASDANWYVKANGQCEMLSAPYWRQMLVEDLIDSNSYRREGLTNHEIWWPAL